MSDATGGVAPTTAEIDAFYRNVLLPKCEPDGPVARAVASIQAKRSRPSFIELSQPREANDNG